MGNIEIALLEKGLPILATTAGAPHDRFPRDSNRYGKGIYEHGRQGANVDVTTLSTGIYEALVTVGGLVVGIIAMFAYNYLTTS